MKQLVLYLWHAHDWIGLSVCDPIVFEEATSLAAGRGRAFCSSRGRARSLLVRSRCTKHGRFDQGIRKVFQSAQPGAVEYYVEYLETDRFPGERQAALLHNYLRQKYANRGMSVIIADSDVTLDFLLKYRAAFAGVPIVFFAGSAHLDLRRRRALPPEDSLTGVVASSASRTTVDLALRSQPET